MLKNIRNRFIILGILTLLALFVSIPSLTKQLPEPLRKILPSEGMRLGLDLQGGMHLILKVNLPKAVKNQLELSSADLREAFRKKKIQVERIEPLGSDRLRLYLQALSNPDPVRKVIKQDFPNLVVLTSLKESGNQFMELGLKPEEIRALRENAVDQTLEIIRNRIDQFGVTEPVIVRQGSDEIVVQLPGVKDSQRAIDLIGRTAQLEFKVVDSEARLDLSELISRAIESKRLNEDFSHQELNRALRGSIPATDEAYLLKEVDGRSGRQLSAPILLKKKTLMTGEGIKSAQVQIDPTNNEPYVGLAFNARGGRIFDRVTGEHVGKRLAIILDDVVQSAPVIRERISGGKAQISGSFTAEEARDLAIVLRAGALPAPVDIVQNLTVGPSLGLDSIRAGIISAILGTVLVVSFMMIYYGVSGLIANLALFLNLLLMVAALSLFDATLTLPGIAGIILSIGMAVDSNVLIFERMREESGTGKPLRAAVDAGYSKALWTIIDSHVTTLITAFALFLFGTGPIKGFAVTLSIGVMFNLFTALYGTRVAYDYMDFKRRLKRLRFLQIIRNARIDFIRLRKAAFIFSALLVGMGLFSFAEIFRGKANLGVDFAGGTMIQFKAEKEFRLDEIRAVLARNQITDYELQEVPKDRILLVRIKNLGHSVGSETDRVSSILSQGFPQNRFILESRAEIGSTVSKDLKKAALTAIAISLAGIIIYLAWRFDLRFGVAAAIATFHDVLAVLGIFYLLNKEITLLIVTALLTLAGYSLTDTVVVFDRIRENLRKKNTKDLGDVINVSINEVLSRTVITSLTVLMVLAALMVTGGILLHDFALALTIGVIIGTYSSVFVASPIVYIWPSKARGRRKKSSVKNKDGTRGTDLMKQLGKQHAA